MIDTSRSSAVPFGRTFISSEAFRTLFREGMLLVEDTAAYLDGPGRDESRLLARDAALAYATESMRLTTRLMQIASWLLVQRAVAEGELTPEQARTEKNRVRISDTAIPTPDAVMALLPQRLLQLVDNSIRMQTRVQHLENLVVAETDDAAGLVERSNGVNQQIDRLRAAFGPSAA